MDGLRLFDTYKRYKTGQNKFTTWLKQTAEKCIYNTSSNNDDEKSKGKSTASQGQRKDASTSTIVRIAEFAGLARTVVANSDSIPRAVIQMLRDVILQRKRAAQHYQKRSGYETSSDDGHLHIINVLEQVLRIFEGAGENKKAKERYLSHSLEAVQNGMSNAEAQMNNLFELLEIEGPVTQEDLNGLEEDVEHEQMIGARKSAKSAKKNSKSKKGLKSRRAAEKTTDLDLIPMNMEYEMETDDDWDLYFLLYCFFEDFNEIREYLQERWCDYMDGVISLSSVAVVTNTAFDMFQRAERELMSLIPRYSGLKNYEKIADLLFLEQGLAHVDYDAEPEQGEDTEDLIYKEADWLALPVFWDLKDLLSRMGPTAIPIVPPAEGLEGKGPHGERKMMQWGKNVLMELMGEICVIKALKTREGLKIPAEDELTRGLTQMLITRQIPIWVIFACQVYLDIRFIMESDVTLGHQELVAAGARINSTVGNYIEFSKPVAERTPKLLQLALDEVDCWITREFMQPARSQVREHVGVSGEGLEPHFYLRRNPLLCGLLVFRSHLTLNEHGLTTANGWGAIVAAAHLYNAVRHELPDFPVWKDMEVLIAMHGEKHMFVGDYPTNRSDYGKRYELATGVSVSNFARDISRRSDNNVVPSRRGPRGLQPTSKVSQVFHDRYCFVHDHPVLTLDNVEALLNESTQSQPQLADLGRLISSTSASGSTPSPSTDIITRARADIVDMLSHSQPLIRAQFERSHALTPIQVLDTLGSSIEHESVLLSFNYFSMHARCTCLLRALYDEFESGIVAMVGRLDEKEGELPMVARFVFGLMAREERGPGAVMVGAVMRGVVEREGSVEIQAVREGLVRSGGGALRLIGSSNA